MDARHVADVGDRNDDDGRELGVFGLDEAGGDNESQTDATVNRLLRAILDMNITPRRFQEGNSLEEFFLKVTGTTDR